jgi:hypothetical protein
MVGIMGHGVVIPGAIAGLYDMEKVKLINEFCPELPSELPRDQSKVEFGIASVMAKLTHAGRVHEIVARFHS